jgi:hypothetical protein
MNYFEAKSIIRYGLGDLRARNGQHEFEQLSCELARRRIASNVVPATGPVGAGGDQGRDFESYRSFLSSAIPNGGTFVARLGDGVMVGACTLQQDDVPAKIKTDLASIFGSGERPKHVAYFCEVNMPTAKQHELKTFCSETYNATLDVFDGNRIADILADPETAWIAENYLRLPADFMPAPDFGPHYEAVRKRWIVDRERPETYSDYVEIKQGLRTAVFSEQAKGDLSHWLDLMRAFADNEEPGSETSRSKYEMCVAELRGNGNLDPALPYFRTYLDGLSVESDVNTLSDGAVLVSYSFGAHYHKATTLSETELYERLGRVEAIIAEKLGLITTRAERATLLEASALLAPLRREGDDDNSLKQRLIDRWSSLVAVVRDVPLFPVLRLGKMMDHIAPGLGSDPRFRALSADVDGLVAAATGSSEAGDRARQRAMTLIDQGNLVAAIDELQRVKIDWFNDSNIRGSIIAMLLIAQMYEELHLQYAARYYAAGAAFIILNEKRDYLLRYLPQALFQIADSFYLSGEGITSIRSVGQALKAHDAFSADPWDWSKHEDLLRSVSHASILRAIVEKVWPDKLPLVDAAIETWPVSKNEAELLAEMSRSAWVETPPAEIVQRMVDEVGVNLLSDLGPHRPLRWAALGVVWEVRYEGGIEERVFALEFAATLQIIQADLAETDLVIVPSDVVIRLKKIDGDKPSWTHVPDNRQHVWEVGMPAQTQSIDAVSMQVWSVAMAVLHEVSALPAERFFELIEERMKRGMTQRSFSVRPARELMRFAEPDGVDCDELSSQTPVDLTVKPIEAEELAWRDDAGPGYSWASAEMALKNRYDISTAAIRRTLPRLLSNRRCAGLIRGLRMEGLLDWQVLSILGSIVAQWQVEHALGHPVTREEIPQFTKLMGSRLYREEREDDPEFDMLALDEERIQASRRVLALSSLRTWGLQNKSETPNFEAAETLLNRRYGHSSDDIDHDDPFPGL